MNDLALTEVPFWTAELVRDIALKEYPVKEVCARLNVSLEQWRVIAKNAEFLKAVEAATKALQSGESAFRLKAQAKADKALKTLGEVMDDPSAPTRDRVAAAGLVIKEAADFGSKSNSGAGGSGAGVTTIQINLG